jgi:DNA ligase-1
VPALEFHYRDGGIYLPHLRLWLDPHRAKQELAFVSHAHSDHTARHREVILTAPTARFMTERLGGKRTEHLLNFGERKTFRAEDGVEFAITLLSAGHIFGSAMSFIEANGESLLYTGDFKLRPGCAAEVCAPRRADALIMETTFGQPRYQFPPAEDVARDIVRFCHETLAENKTAVLHAYSLGKSQELLGALRHAGLPLMLHPSVFTMTKLYEEFGHAFPSHENFDATCARGRVIIWPPNGSAETLATAAGPMRRAVITGWALDAGCKYQNRCDAAFPLSDHADFPDLIEFVKQVQPRHVFTLHGFAADFAGTLRGLGFDARALSEDEQLELGLRLVG